MILIQYCTRVLQKQTTVLYNSIEIQHCKNKCIVQQYSLGKSLNISLVFNSIPLLQSQYTYSKIHAECSFLCSTESCRQGYQGRSQNLAKNAVFSHASTPRLISDISAILPLGHSAGTRMPPTQPTLASLAGATESGQSCACCHCHCH